MRERTSPFRAVVAAAAAAGTAAVLGTTGLAGITDVTRPDALVGSAVMLLGALAALVLALGCTALTLAALAGSAGRSARRLHAIGARLTPALLRRALAVSLGAGLGLGAAAGPAIAGEADLGWRPTGSTTAAAGATVGADDSADDDLGDGLDVVPVAAVAPVAPPAAPVVATVASTPNEHAPPDTPSGDVHVVRPGETLWDVAAAHLPADATDADVAAAWPQWWSANRDVVGADPDLIHPGQELRAPAQDPTEAGR